MVKKMNIQKSYIGINEKTRSGEKILKVEGIIIHTCEKSIRTSKELLKKIEESKKEVDKYLSYHYIISEKSNIINIIPTFEMAYHSDKIYLNEHYIGICVIRDKIHSMSNKQRKILKSLIQYILDKFNLDRNSILREYDIYSTRKSSLIIDNGILWDEIID